MRDVVPLADLPLGDILVKRRALKRQLLAGHDLHPLRIAVLGGSTTQELVDLLELWLLESGFAPVIYQSQFGRYYVEAVHDTEALRQFKPALVYLHTSVVNIESFAPIHVTESEFEQHVVAEFSRFQRIWASLQQNLDCVVIQNNIEFPPQGILGNLDVVAAGGRTRFVSELNRRFAHAASASSRLLMQDVCSIAARLGLERWHDARRWFSFKLPITPEASNALATSLAAMIRGLFGRARKVLVLDLDNTLWGGVIGDDGVERIQLGRETTLGEAYTAFQEYCLALRDRGILLAVCSKNDEAIAREGFDHPDSVLKLHHFASFKANWNPKPENICAIAAELKLDPASFVFVDDNPAERAIVSAQCPEIAVPEIGSDVAAFANIIEAGRYFEQASLSPEDKARPALYQSNAQRATQEAKFFQFADYLDSLEMTAEIDIFKPVYMPRITQLVNKTNQFNLTTRRYTPAELEAVLDDPAAIGLYGRLSDRFGDNGLISVLLAHRKAEVFEIDLWLMSCRVLKRDMESAMLDELAARAQAAGARFLQGTYLPTRKNALVADHYPLMGFEKVSREPDGSAVYRLALPGYQPRNRHIRVLHPASSLVLAGA